MHYTLHLTDRCNLACRYCYVKKGCADMTPEIAGRVMDMAAAEGGHHGIVFFGGEPLLCRDLIEETVAYAEEIQRTGKCYFHFKITTNGLLLDEDFLSYACRHDIFVALSHDGLGNDTERLKPDGRGSREEIEKAAALLLAYKPYSPVMMTVTPSTLPLYADSVKYLYDLGFRYIICTMDYSALWRDRDLLILKRQYRRLATFYRELMQKEEKFYLSPFEVKISSHIHRSNLRAERCELGKKQISVSPDGKIYPCVQLAGDERFYIGNVHDGIDEEARERLYHLNEREKEECAGCALRNRCNHYCACLNKGATGDITKVSPFLCGHERILIPIADGLAERLYKEKSALFIQKQYNDMFPLVSLTEDKTVK